jgi:hypothetical protein
VLYQYHTPEQADDHAKKMLYGLQTHEYAAERQEVKVGMHALHKRLQHLPNAIFSHVEVPAGTARISREKHTAADPEARAPNEKPRQRISPVDDDHLAIDNSSNGSM